MPKHRKYFVTLTVLLNFLILTYASYLRTSDCSEENECIPYTSCAEVENNEAFNPKICGWFFETRNIAMVCCPRPPIKRPNGTSKISPEGCGIRMLSPTSSPLIEREIFYIAEERTVNIDDEKNMDLVSTEEPMHHLVVGGENATIRWPWMVGLYQGAWRNFICGGVLIDDRHILTAAHCFDEERPDPRSYSVHIGDLFLSDNNSYWEIEDIKKHPDYNRRYIYDDIAIILLSKPAPSDSPPACMLYVDDIQEREHLTVLGWGALFYDGPSPVRLQEVHELPVVNSVACYNKLRRNIRGQFPKQTWNKFICAGLKEGRKDACQGDSGGPLLRQNPTGVWSVVGIVSGQRCAAPENPGIYTKVSSYYEWISDYIDKQNEVTE